MATSSSPVPPMPDASIPLVTPDGRMHPDWYRWLKALVDTVKTIRAEIP